MKNITNILRVAIVLGLGILTSIAGAENNIIENFEKEKLAPYFYEITGNNIDPNNPVYLLGTCHSLVPEDYSDYIRNKVENAEMLISEVEELAAQMTIYEYSLALFSLAHNKFIEQDLYWFRDQFIALGLAPNEIKDAIQLIQKERNKLEDPAFFESWFGQFTMEEQRTIEEISAKLGINLASMHPVLLMEYILPNIKNAIEKEFEEDYFEVYLIKLFSENNKEVIYLDTMEMGSWVVAQDLVETLSKDLGESLKELKKDLIAKPECDVLEKKCWNADDYSQALDIEAIILLNDDNGFAMRTRNIAWKKIILRALSSGKSAAIVAGAHHMIGETGFLSLLKSQGYNIKHAFIDESMLNEDDVIEYDEDNDDESLEIDL